MTRDGNLQIDLHGLIMEISASEAVLNAVANRFADFPSGEMRSPDFRFVIQSIRSPALHEIQRPNGPSRAFYQTNIGDALYFPKEDVGYIEYGPGARVWFRPASGECRISILQPESDQQLWLATHPLFTIPLQEMLKRRGTYGIHAAGLARNGRSLLLQGTSGSGKSTLTIALLKSGFDWLSDDLVLLDPSDGLHTLAFPEKIKATQETLSMFAELDAAHGTKLQGWPKYQLRAQDFFTSSIVWRSVPAVLVFPVIANRDESSLSPLTGDEAFLLLSSSVLLTETQSTRSHIGALAELAKTVPAYRLHTGRDFDQVASLLGALLQ